LAGCSKQKIDLSQGQRFLHALVPDQAACDRIRQNGVIFNCFQEIQFQEDRRVTVVVTDIQNLGRYVYRGDKIIIQFEQGFDVPDKMELKVLNENTLVDENGFEWKRWEGPGTWDFYE